MTTTLLQTRMFSALGLAVAVAVALPTLGVAQPAGASTNQTMSVLVITLKPDMVDEWTDLIKHEVIPALKKAGVPSLMVSQTVLGNGSEFSIVTPVDKMAIFDDPPPFERALGRDGANRLLAKLRKCGLFSRSFLSTMLADLSNPPEPGKVPPIQVLSRYRVAQGKMAEYENYLKTEILPHYKKANVRMSVYRRGLGATPNEVVVVTTANTFAEIEGGPPLRKILGNEAYTKLQAKASGLRTLVDTTVRRYRSDLSY